jgi:hypothetical protein
VAIHQINELVLQGGSSRKRRSSTWPNQLLAQDSLANRVLRANGTGPEFQHLDTPRLTNGRAIPLRAKRGTRQRA